MTIKIYDVESPKRRYLVRDSLDIWLQATSSNFRVFKHEIDGIWGVLYS